MEKQNSPTRSVERALQILECFLDKEEMILLEIAEKTNLSSSTVLRILNALQEHDFIIKNHQTKKYHLGNKVVWLANMVPSESYEDLKRIAYPHMLAINEKYNEDIRLFVQDGNAKLCIEAVESTRELRQVIKVGSRHDLQRGAAGKVMLSYMTPKERRKMLNESEVDDKSFEAFKERGYTVSAGEREEGLFGMAVPVMDENNKLVAAISLSGPTARFENESLEEKKIDLLQMGRNISEDWQNRKR